MHLCLTVWPKNCGVKKWRSCLLQWPVIPRTTHPVFTVQQHKLCKGTLVHCIQVQLLTVTKSTGNYTMHVMSRCLSAREGMYLRICVVNKYIFFRLFHHHLNIQ